MVKIQIDCTKHGKIDMNNKCAIREHKIMKYGEVNSSKILNLHFNL